MNIKKITFLISFIMLTITALAAMKQSTNKPKRLVLRINLVTITNNWLNKSLEKVKNNTFNPTTDAFDVQVKDIQDPIRGIMNKAAQKWAHNLLENEQSFDLIINFFQQQPEGPLKQNLCKEIEQIEIAINNQTQEEIDG